MLQKKEKLISELEQLSASGKPGNCMRAAEADRVAPVVASSPNSARNQTQNAVGPTQLYSKYDVILFPRDQMVPDTHVMGGPTERKEARSEAVLTSDRLFRRTLPFKLQLELQLLLSSIYLA